MKINRKLLEPYEKKVGVCVRTYWELCVGFARTGVTGYGGGPSTIPLIEYEAVKKYKWMTEEEFGDSLALANTLPGPIATKMAAYIGYKIKGPLGAFVAIMAHIVPSIIAMIGLLGGLYAFKNSPVVKGMIHGVAPVVGVMLAVMAYQFFQKGRQGLGNKWMIGMSLFSLCIIQVLNLHPGFVIIFFLTSAFVWSTYKESGKVPFWIKRVVRSREEEL
ncbi:chromate transporter [Fictibacillus sp. b24]|uniref:chromate transporter n=1 Tax=Fictibacillus sp. b24 TaxID=3055863 RepID=UPI0025A1AEB2|nr:chromate transporter [Fictibacillus sp. b24]MDM5315031.1 chromate transporter [Fictibacillus sp. b24]